MGVKNPDGIWEWTLETASRGWTKSFQKFFERIVDHLSNESLELVLMIHVIHIWRKIRYFLVNILKNSHICGEFSKIMKESPNLPGSNPWKNLWIILYVKFGGNPRAISAEKNEGICGKILLVKYERFFSIFCQEIPLHNLWRKERGNLWKKV